MEYYNFSVQDTVKNLKSSKEGLSEKDASSRLQKYGKNEIEVKKGTSPFVIFLRQFKSAVVYILIAALIISAFLREVVDSVVIAAILVMNSIFGFVQEYKAEKAIEALKKLESLKARVLRNGKIKIIDSSLLVPGDVILLETGDKIPADARLLEEKELKTQEAILTGESTPVKKSIELIKNGKAVAEQENMLFSGTSIVSGRGKAIITSTGMLTQIGKIAGLIEKIEQGETPLQKKVKDLGKFLGIAVIVIALIVFVGGFLRGGDIIEMLLVGVSLAVAAIPEGLVVVMTIALALATQRMVKRKVLMRKLAAVETLGSTTVICADKTGTLTKNEMTVRKLFVNGKIIDVTGRGYEKEGKFLHNESEVDLRDIKLLLKIGTLNNNSALQDLIGDPTEIALLVSAEKAKLKRDALEIQEPRVDEVLFTSERKVMTTVHKTKDFREGKVVYTKGAVEIVLALCNKIYDHGRVRRILTADKVRILKTNEKFASSALRVLAFAFNPLRNEKKKEYEKDLVFVGLQAMIDPPREEVKEAIEKCKQAGIDVKMITGDHALTAKAIAEEVGLKGKVVTGQWLEGISDKDLEKNVKDIVVFARVNPEHKLRIVEALQKKGEVVAMTGDGVNDAPALKKADIGVAMGIKGTDVSKEASDMILQDDNFSSIVNAVEEGRGSYDNIKKFTNYLLSSNLGEVLIIFLAILIGFTVDRAIALPLIAVQILWINLVTDGLPALALGVDPVSKDIMKRKPREKGEGIVTKSMALNILLTGILMAVIALFIFERYLPDLAKAQTMVLTTLVIFEIVRAYMIKANYGKMFNNKLLLIAIALAIALQLIVVYTPLNVFFKTVPLVLKDWIAIGAATLVFAVLGFSAQASIKRFTRKVLKKSI